MLKMCISICVGDCSNGLFLKVEHFIRFTDL